MLTNSVGVVVGRFQVPELHEGHRHLINYVSTHNTETLIILGSGRGFQTRRNPLPFEIRRAMIRDTYPQVTIAQLFDHPSDIRWSEDLDRIISTLFPSYDVTLYGSRDSFLPYYHGKFRTELIGHVPSPDGTTIRTECCTSTLSTDFRKGLIRAQIDRAPIPYPVVDVAIVRTETHEVLLGQKEHDMGRWRFIGGFFDPAQDTTLEAAARREAFEETSGLEIGSPQYVGSRIIDDWRYRKDQDRIISSFFTAPYIFGAPRPGDDLDALSWFPHERVLEALAPEHYQLGELLMEALAHTS